MGSKSSHLEDDDVLVKTTKGCYPTPKNPPQIKGQKSIQQDYECPPISIFKNQNANTLLLVNAYLRLVNNNLDISDTIIILCRKYHSELYPSLQLNSNNNNKYICNNIDDHSFNDIFLGNNTSIIAGKPILKITVENNLKMEWNSLIKNDYKKGTIILTIFGDLNMSKNTNILSQNNGNIYIQCNNLIMRSSSNISTSGYNNINILNNMDLNHSLSTQKNMFGNIYINIKNSIIIDKICNIRSGNIKIDCNLIKIKMKSKICAIRNNLLINATNGMDIDDDEKNVFAAVNIKQINTNQTNQLNINQLIGATKLKHKLSIFNDDEEFECIICFDNEPNIIIKPCGHSTFCHTCIDDFKPTECPICRTIIDSTVRY